MNKQVYINVPVSDVARSTAFYEALGFIKNPDFSNEDASALMWSNDILLMILDRNFYKRFIGDKQIADTHTASAALFALSMDNKEAVTKFAETAKANGGDYYQVDMGMSEDMMFGYEVLDPDGSHWEPVWMNQNFAPHDENSESSKL